MKSLSEEEFNKKAKEPFNSIFATVDPYGEPFRKNIQHRLFLYGFRWELHDPWISPLVETMNEVGEKGFYVTALERPAPEDQIQPYHWYIPLSEVSSYGSVVFSQQNAIYSTSGKWGIICSDEDHALVGGDKQLIDNILASVPDLDDRLNQFFDAWKYYNKKNKVDIQWIVPMLSHVYGSEKAEKLIRNAGLEWLFADK